MPPLTTNRKVGTTNSLTREQFISVPAFPIANCRFSIELLTLLPTDRLRQNRQL